ncbi:MAG: pseudouridine-5'-phosphate glycosidase [Actinomycetota bacterium]|nr:pseudouridine-5'-phosphate glycosidase [Actinomycetota bacterium]MEC9450106.1 pseudouridine-5'-phosphate glycosidase [Actinomycetota bacterium]MED5439081.1 pseudouridine-5'-phosphate glycosidase [Actinomycetota bacterium]MEE3205921.1 pseudouridine-5'-phosphate glycosidase [Actinomycetota bacterium]
MEQKSTERLQVSDEVSTALANGRAVVALESTIVSHGLPSPRNVETALACAANVRAAGAVPATVAVIDGSLRVGLSVDEIERLGSGEAEKASLRDLGYLLAEGRTGSTTVAATLFASHRAGIRLFATGGIGGVHRGNDRDISADLNALATLPVAVVCAGVKAVLDLPRTVEALETLGVPVVGQGTNVMPEFWTRGGDLPVSVRSDHPATTAGILHAHWGCGLLSGVVVANPIPVADEADPQTITAAIVGGLAAADAAGVRGRDVTPFLLAHIGETTRGVSLEANVALVEHNATVAAEIATVLATLPALNVERN